VQIYLVSFVDTCDLKACTRKFLRVRPTEIDLRVLSAVALSQHLRSIEYSNFLITEKFED